MGWLHGRRLRLITPPLLRPHYGSIQVSTTSLLHPSYEYVSALGEEILTTPCPFPFFTFVWNVVCHYNEVPCFWRRYFNFEPLGGAYAVVIKKRRYLKYYLTWHVMKI